MKNKLKYSSFTKRQEGIALFAALMLISIMAILGFRIAEQGKDNTIIAGSNVRYNQVFEAGELTLRKTMLYIQNIRGGEPIATATPYNVYKSPSMEAIYSNFEISKIKEGNIDLLMSSTPAYSFIWEGGALGRQVCTPFCETGVDFYRNLDANIWDSFAIKSNFTADEGIASDATNHIANIRTFTFIEKIEGGEGGSKGGTGGSSKEMKGNGTDSKKYYYRITVKASGYPPGLPEAEMNAVNSRENVIVQSVFAQLY